MNQSKTLLKTPKYSGFTIVELLVVIVVIGILAAIALVSYTGVTNRANIAVMQSDLSNSSKRLKIYQATYGSYPTIDSTTKCPTAPTADNTLCLKASPNNTFTYTTDGTTFRLVETNTNGMVYNVTDSTGPAIASTSLAVTDPTNWLAVGTQVWAKANANVGTMVTGATQQTSGNGIEKYCYDDIESNCTTYGGLYQWDEAMQYVAAPTPPAVAQGICPTGSHIPSDTEWKTLEMSLSGMLQATADLTGWRGTDEGTKLKSGGSSGLNIPLAGSRYTDGSNYGLSSYADLWSSSEPDTRAWEHYLESGNAAVGRTAGRKDYAFSVRCLGN